MCVHGRNVGVNYRKIWSCSQNQVSYRTHEKVENEAGKPKIRRFRFKNIKIYLNCRFQSIIWYRSTWRTPPVYVSYYFCMSEIVFFILKKLFLWETRKTIKIFFIYKHVYIWEKESTRVSHKNIIWNIDGWRTPGRPISNNWLKTTIQVDLSLIHIWRCRRRG